MAEQLLILAAGVALVLAWLVARRRHQEQDYRIAVQRRLDAIRAEEDEWRRTVILAGELFEWMEPDAWSGDRHDA